MINPGLDETQTLEVPIQWNMIWYNKKEWKNTCYIGDPQKYYIK